MSREAEAAATATLDSLLGGGFEQAEVYQKSSRGRAALWEPDQLTCSGVEEKGWAVRASDRDGSIHSAGTGAVPPDGPWPSPASPPLELPTVEVAAGARDAPAREEDADDLDAPLLGEGEVLALLRSVSERLGVEHPRARLLQARLEDGVAEVSIRNSHGVRAAHRLRVATLELWAALGGTETRITVAAREPRRFAVGSLARRLADQLVVLAEGAPPEGAERGPAVLAGEVIAGVLGALRDLWFEPGGWSRLAATADGEGRLGSPAVTLVDDGRLRGGLLAAPVDGEGVATGRVALVEAGVPAQTLRSWRDQGSGRPSGCIRRPGWRDRPRAGPSHLHLEPNPRVAASSLLAELGSGAYLLGLEGAPRVDWDERRITLPVYGFAIGSRGESRPLRGARASAPIAELLGGIRKVARDLRFVQALGGCVGSPSVLIEALRVEPG